MHHSCDLLSLGSQLFARIHVSCAVQGKLAVCFADCAEEYEGKLDKLKFDIAAELARLTSRVR